MMVVGKRKKAIARAIAKEGSGKVFVNGRPLQTMYNEAIRMKILEPMMLVEKSKTVDIHVNVKGGGVWGQADAIATAIGKALVAYFKDDETIRSQLVAYDRMLVVSDARRTEPHKPSRSSAGPRRKKQQSKR